jgi:hypothetical protein
MARTSSRTSSSAESGSGVPSTESNRQTPRAMAKMMLSERSQKLQKFPAPISGVGDESTSWRSLYQSGSSVPSNCDSDQFEKLEWVW